MDTEVKASANRDLNVWIAWNLFLLYSRSRAVHRVMQRINTIHFGRHTSCGNVHREMDLFRDAQDKTAMHKLQSARTHDFLAVSFS